jgi:hypothetical protein
MKKTNKNKIACVVGSGASSYALLHRLVKQKKYSKIYVVTTGSYKETFTLNNPSSSISENIQNKMFSLIPEKLLFGNNRIYKRTDAQELYLEGYSIKTSHQFSGLVNIWGANVCFPTENDIKKYPNLLAYIPYFNSVANILKVSGDSSWVSGKGNFSKSFELVRSSRANEFNHSWVIVIKTI